MEPLEYWRACEELTVIQAILLIVGVDPSLWQHRIEDCPPQDRPIGYDAVAAALFPDVLGGRLRTTIHGVTVPHATQGWP